MLLIIGIKEVQETPAVATQSPVRRNSFPEYKGLTLVAEKSSLGKTDALLWSLCQESGGNLEVNRST